MSCGMVTVWDNGQAWWGNTALKRSMFTYFPAGSQTLEWVTMMWKPLCWIKHIYNTFIIVFLPLKDIRNMNIQIILKFFLLILEFQYRFKQWHNIKLSGKSDSLADRAQSWTFFWKEIPVLIFSHLPQSKAISCVYVLLLEQGKSSSLSWISSEAIVN